MIAYHGTACITGQTLDDSEPMTRSGDDDADTRDVVSPIKSTACGLSDGDHGTIIEIVQAVILDRNKTVCSDIVDEVRAVDGIWSAPVNDGDYVQVTFEEPLQSINDITIIARSNGTSRIDVYIKDGILPLGSFENITRNSRHRISLTTMSGRHRTFELRTSGDAVAYEYIVDPTGWISPTGAADPSGQWTYEPRVYDENTGSYAYHAGALGWRGYLELSLSASLYCDRVRVFSDFDTYYVDRVSIDIYNSTTWIEKYNGTISDCVWTEVEFSPETNVTQARFRYHYIRGSVQLWFYEFDFWQGQPHTVPNGTTLDATSIDETTAILKGNVTDEGGEPCEYRFQYGVNTSYGTNTSWGGSEVRGSEFSTMIHNLTLGATYQFRAQIRNDMGIVNGSNKNFTTATPSLGWVSPTSHYDSNSQWTNEKNAYDDDTETFTQSYHDINDPDGQWSFFIYLNHSTMMSDKIRFYARGPTGDSTQVDQVDVDVRRGGVWVDIYQGTFSDQQWVEKRFMQGSVNQTRIRFHVNVNNGGLYYQLYEFDINNSRPVPMICDETPVNRTWGVGLRPSLNITVSNPDGAPMAIQWSSNSSGSWQPFGSNSSVGNGTYRQRNDNFSGNNTRYWWKITVTDEIDSNTSWFYFSTPDLLRPSSNVIAITPFWKKTSTTISVAAADTGWSGLKNTTFYYRFSGDNSSWGGWVNGGVDTALPWSWSFSYPNGTGYYQFYSIAADNATNIELASGSADAGCGYETTPPSSSVSAQTKYWKNTAATITASASDTMSGVKNVTLYYRFSTTNSSWGGYVRAGVDPTSPWSWSFPFVNGTGYYQFYSIAVDNAANIESNPGSADAWAGFENHLPSSVVTSIPEYWISSSPVIIISTVNDTGPSGVRNVTLFYSYRATNMTSWGSNISSGVDFDPWVSCSWTFSFPDGLGHYRFFTTATDNATNTELPPGGTGDMTCGFNTQAPVSSVDETTPYWISATSRMISCTAVDYGPSGLKNVTLYYYNSTDNASWDGPWLYGVDDDPWVACSWVFLFPNQTGYYRFFSRATDNSSHGEEAPLINDTGCGFDVLSPSCQITYNRSAGSFKAADSLTISANFTEAHSGMNHSSVRMAIMTNGNGSLTNVSMHLIDNTHYDYGWVVPAGSDDDGPFTVRIYAFDNASNILTPYPTLDASKNIDNTLPTIANLSITSISPDSVIICWVTTENTTSQIEYGLTSSYGTWFNSSAYVISHHCIVPGLSSGTTYHYRVLSVDSAGNHAPPLTGMFTIPKQTQKSRYIVPVHGNAPPSDPTISGPTTGNTSQLYTFTVRSLDADNDPLIYTFAWGDGTTESSEQIPQGMNYVRDHHWLIAGKYTITVTAADNTSGSSSEKTIWIDTLAVDDEGYLVDNDSDGIFDTFHYNATGTDSVMLLKNGNYLIDVDGDHRWDYEYNTTTGMLMSVAYQPSQTQQIPLPLLMDICLIGIVCILLVMLVVRRRSHKKQ